MKQSFAELGDNSKEPTLFQVGKEAVDLSFIRDLRKNHPELYAEFKETRARILRLTGQKNLADLMGRSNDRELINTTRRNIALERVKIERGEKKEKSVEGMGFFQRSRMKIASALSGFAERLFPARLNEDISEMEARLRDYGLQADKFIEEEVVGKFFPDHTKDLHLKNEVKNCNDPAKLLMMAFDPAWHEKVRFEAKRKLRLMELFEKVNDFLKEQNLNENDLSFFDDMMNDHVYAHGDSKKGAHVAKELVTTHDPSSFQVTGWFLVDKGEVIDYSEMSDEVSSQDKVMRTQIPFRKFMVGENGHSREIEFMIDARRKTKEGMALKMLRKDTNDPEALLGDLNGVRMIFKKEDHVDLFEYSMKSKLREAGYEVNFSEHRSAVGNNGSLGCRKYDVAISKDGVSRNYEMQIFTFDEYANYLYSEEDAWPEYEIRRFFESSSSEALFPSEIYHEELGEVNRQDIARSGQDIIRDQLTLKAEEVAKQKPEDKPVLPQMPQEIAGDNSQRAQDNEFTEAAPIN